MFDKSMTAEICHFGPVPFRSASDWTDPASRGVGPRYPLRNFPTKLSLERNGNAKDVLALFNVFAALSDSYEKVSKATIPTKIC